MRYNLTVVDTQYRRYLLRFFIFIGTLFQHFLGGGSVARSPFSATTRVQLQPFGAKIQVSAETFAVANLADNTVFSAASAGFSSRISAQDFLHRTVAANPALAGSLHVLGQYELQP